MATEWFYTKDEEQIGPVASKELKRLAGIRELQPSDQIWKEGMPEWVPASTVKGLFPAAPTPASTQATPSLPPVPPPMPEQSSEQSNQPTESASAVGVDAPKGIGEKIANVATSEQVQGFVTLAKAKWMALSIAGKGGVIAVASVMTVVVLSVVLGGRESSDDFLLKIANLQGRESWNWQQVQKTHPNFTRSFIYDGIPVPSSLSDHKLHNLSSSKLTTSSFIECKWFPVEGFCLGIFAAAEQVFGGMLQHQGQSRQAEPFQS